ncbi:MAG: UDP-N-acetylglucosamine pyrophosphorylase [Ruminococcaceae bacterium]|nr:UDP-N-acetylglucosamine pyrophosphorylase [Oscillospiraceae bacterium]
MSEGIGALTVEALYRHPEGSLAWNYLRAFRYPWEALEGLSEELYRLGRSLSREEYRQVEAGVWVARTARVAPTAVITAPAIIGAETELRPGAFLRGSTLVGRRCVVGNSTELKGCILFDGVQVPHYNYVGDSVLGYQAHMGAGAVTSNVKGDKSLVAVRSPWGTLETGRKKCGAMLGDYAEIGCHAVLNPGSVVGVSSRVYPLVSVRGTVPEGCICKGEGVIVPIK